MRIIFFVLLLSGFICSSVFCQSPDLVKKSWDVKEIDLARGAKYLSELEKDVVMHINMLRLNLPSPQSLSSRGL